MQYHIVRSGVSRTVFEVESKLEERQRVKICMVLESLAHEKSSCNRCYANTVPLQGCLIIRRLETAADACDLLDNESLPCLYRILIGSCGLEHFDTLTSAAALNLRRKARHTGDGQHPEFLLPLEEIRLWQGKPPPTLLYLHPDSPPLPSCGCSCA